MIEPAKRLDEKGRCCGRKPLVYKSTSLGIYRVLIDSVSGATALIALRKIIRLRIGHGNS